jgi:hypothetical protein
VTVSPWPGSDWDDHCTPVFRTHALMPVRKKRQHAVIRNSSVSPFLVGRRFVSAARAHINVAKVSVKKVARGIAGHSHRPTSLHYLSLLRRPYCPSGCVRYAAQC